MSSALADITDPGFLAQDDPWTALKELRREAPLHWHEDAQLWTVSRHADVLTVSRDPQTFCSGKGVLVTGRENPVSASDSILFLDPPEHQQHRKLVNPGFHLRRITALEPRVRALTVELLDAVEPGRPFDFVDAVAAPLPLLVIAELLGVPTEDRARFRTWSDAIIAAATEPTEETLTQAAELFEYFGSVIEARRAEPADDMISVLVHGDVDGEKLTDLELLGFCMTLLVAGNETTRNLLSGGTKALAEHPDQLDLLQKDPALIPGAVEELLRWVTPIAAFGRTATRDTELAGQKIDAGQYLVLLYTSANRDEDAFGDTADTFDIRRQPNPHVAFGFGEHFCLGASLARLEARVFLEEVLPRYGRIELAGEVERLRSTLMRGIERLPVVLDR